MTVLSHDTTGDATGDRTGDATGAHDVDHGAALALATALASTPSLSGQEGDAIALVADAMRAARFAEVEIDDIGNVCGIMWGAAGPGSSDGRRLLIDGHIDTIPLHSADRWSVDPHGGVVRDGRLYGLGICDQKASIAAAVAGVAAARSRGLHGPVAVVASVCEEEMEGAALRAVIDRFRPDAVVTSEPTDTRLCVGQRGRAKAWVRIVGRSCHAGHKSAGIDAIEAFTDLLVALRALDHPVHPVLGRRDLTCIDVLSSPNPSVSTVAGEVLARFDCRFVPGETPETILALLTGAAAVAWAGWREPPQLELGLVEATFRTWTGAAFTVPEYAAAWWTAPDGPLVTAATAALVEVGLDPTPSQYAFCTNGSLTAGVLGIPTIGFGVGKEHISHQIDEHVELASLRRGADGFAALACHLTRSIG